jgi:hypothetical protein
MSNSKKIIGYIHVCQIEGWKRSFDMIFNCIQNFGLYDVIEEIRIGVISDSGLLIPDDRFNDAKIKIIYIGKSNEYERPTLLHMRDSSLKDGLECKYFYLHTKGLRHFGTDKENYVIDWIHLMLYWNIIKWKIALEKLENYNTYGCEELKEIFYSGNYWWATSEHISKLPDEIEDKYTAPEEWLLQVKENIYSVYSSGFQGQGHYYRRFKKDLYYLVEDRKYISIPDNFNVYQYKELNKDLKDLSINQCLEHYITNGKNEKRPIHKQIKNDFNKNISNNGFPLDFDYIYYRNYYADLNKMNDEELKNHWLKHGKTENRKYRSKYLLPNDFDINFYKNYYDDNKNKSNKELIEHYMNIGKFDNRIYKEDPRLSSNYVLPSDFNPENYKKKYIDLKLLNNEQLITHWLNNGRLELRNYK